MANLWSTTEMAQVLDQRQIWFTNLLMLGFDPVAQEDKTKVRFCREMFCHINKKGMEVTLHYLFNKLDSHIAYEEFRDCWPVYDKKQEAQFRKVCSNWLTKIAKENPESKIPRLSASLLMSPGGERFDQLMLRFTTYVLRVVCMREAKGEEKQVFLSSFITSPNSLRTSTNRHLLQRALQCHVIRHSRSVASRLELTSELHEQWKQHVIDQVKELRSLTKEKRELEAQIKAASTAHPSVETSSTLTPGADRARKNKMKTVREFWKCLEEFLSKTVHEREVLDLIGKGNANKYTIDAKDLKFQTPDEILHMYEAQLREGTVENTFEDGKLNLLSLVQLWNCALQVIRDRFRECELPSFKAESKEMTDILQAHRVNLATSQNLRASLMDYQQSLQDNIEKLEEQLQVLRGSSSHFRAEGEREGSAENSLHVPLSHRVHIPPITLPSLGLELLPPSPQKSHDPSSPDMRHLQKHLSHLSLPSDPVSTPEAIHNISQSVQRQSRSHKPVHSYSHSSSIPKRVQPASEAANHSSLSTPAQTTSESSVTPTAKSSMQGSKSHTKHARPHPPHKSGLKRSGLTRGATSRTGTSRRTGGGKSVRETRTEVGVDVSSGGCVTSVPRTLSPQLTPTTPRLMDAMPAAHDILATQIACAVASSSPHTPEQQIYSLTDPLSPLGTGAFVSRDKIPRTPMSKATGAEVTVRSQETTPSPTATSHHTPATTHSLSATSSTQSPLHTSHSSPPTPHSQQFPLHISYSSPSTSHSSLHTAHSSHPTSHSSLHTSHSSHPTSHSSLHTSHSSPPHIPFLSPTPPVLLESSTDDDTGLLHLSSSHPPPLVLDSPAMSPTPHSFSPSLPTPKMTATPHSSPNRLSLSPTSLVSGAVGTVSEQSVTTEAGLTASPLIDLSSPLSLGLSADQHLSTPSISLQQAEQLRVQHVAAETVTSPLINLSSPISLRLSASPTPTKSRSSGTTPSTEGDLMSSTSHPANARTKNTLKSEQVQSPLLMQFSSSPRKQPSSLLTPAVAKHTPGVLLQTTPGSSLLSGSISTHIHPTGEPLITTCNHSTVTATKASPLFTAIARGQSPAQPTPFKAPITPSQCARDSSSKTTSATSPFSTGMMSSPFLLSSQPSSPFLHAELDQSLPGDRENGQPCNDDLMERRSIGVDYEGQEEKQTVVDDRDDSNLHTAEETPNEIPLGLLIQVPTSAHATGALSHSPSTHVDTSGSAQAHSQQLIDFSSSDDVEWRPLDVSGDHLNSPSPIPSPPLNNSSHTPLSHPFKSVEETHSNGGIGLFEENDSFLVPLSPQSDFSSQEDTAH